MRIPLQNQRMALKKPRMAPENVRMTTENLRRLIFFSEWSFFLGFCDSIRVSCHFLRGLVSDDCYTPLKYLFIISIYMRTSYIVVCDWLFKILVLYILPSTAYFQLANHDTNKSYYAFERTVFQIIVS